MSYVVFSPLTPDPRPREAERHVCILILWRQAVTKWGAECILEINIDGLWTTSVVPIQDATPSVTVVDSGTACATVRD